MGQDPGGRIVAEGTLVCLAPSGRLVELPHAAMMSNSGAKPC